MISSAIVETHAYQIAERIISVYRTPNNEILILDHKTQSKFDEYLLIIMKNLLS